MRERGGEMNDRLWDMVMDALSKLNERYHFQGAESEETKEALEELMAIYDEWLG